MKHKVANRKSSSGPVEIKTDGRTVWVNGPAGGMLARLGPMGIDVHEVGRWSGDKHCVDCRPCPPVDVWDAFVASVKRHHALEIPKSFRPGWCK